MWARLENNVAVEVTSTDPEGRYHASLTWVECPLYVSQGYTYSDGMFLPPEKKEYDI